MSSKPWHFVFFIFNSYSHAHSNLKRASSIPKLFFFSHFFLILSFATIPPQYFTLFKFTSSKPCLFFFYMRFFFSSTSSIPVFFFLFFSLFCSYVLHYNLHTSHALKTWVRLPGLFFTHFLLHVLASSIILLTFKIFFTTRFFSLHTLLYYYYYFFFLFLSIIHTNKFLTLKQNANKIYLH